MKHPKKHNTHHSTPHSHYHKPQSHHAPHHTHHKVKRKSLMEKKTLIWSIVVVFALIIIAIGIILFVDIGKEEEIVLKPDPVAEQCASFCDSNQRDAFCKVRITAEEGVRATCDEFSTDPKHSKYNVQTCPTIDCAPTSQEMDKTCVTGLNSEWIDATAEGKCPAKEGYFSIKRDEYSDEPPVEGQICCFYYE